MICTHELKTENLSTNYHLNLIVRTALNSVEVVEYQLEKNLFSRTMF